MIFKDALRGGRTDKEKKREEFYRLIDDIHAKYEKLISMTPIKANEIINDTPKGGVYLFSENGKGLYVGRTKRKIKERLKDHYNKSSNDAPFAFRLAREATGYLKASYKKEGSQKELLKNPQYRKAYDNAKERISDIDVRYIGEADPVRQALLEIYVAFLTEAKYNDFDTH